MIDAYVAVEVGGSYMELIGWLARLAVGLAVAGAILIFGLAILPAITGANWMTEARSARRSGKRKRHEHRADSSSPVKASVSAAHVSIVPC